MYAGSDEGADSAALLVRNLHFLVALCGDTSPVLARSKKVDIGHECGRHHRHGNDATVDAALPSCGAGMVGS